MNKADDGRSGQGSGGGFGGVGGGHLIIQMKPGADMDAASQKIRTSLDAGGGFGPVGPGHLSIGANHILIEAGRGADLHTLKGALEKTLQGEGVAEITVAPNQIESPMNAERSGDFLSTRRLVIAAFCVLFPLLLFMLGIFSGYLVYDKDRLWEFCTNNFNVVFGIPMAIIASLAVVVILVTTSPKDKLSIKLLSALELTGPSVPIVLWMGCFLTIIFGIYAMSGHLRGASAGASASDAASASQSSRPTGSGQESRR